MTTCVNKSGTPGSPCAQIMSQTGSRQGIVNDQILAKGYNTNYTASWFLVRTRVLFDSTGDFAVSPSGCPAGVKSRNSTAGPLNSAYSDSSGTPANFIPLLGCGATLTTTLTTGVGSFSTDTKLSVSMTGGPVRDRRRRRDHRRDSRPRQRQGRPRRHSPAGVVVAAEHASRLPPIRARTPRHLQYSVCRRARRRPDRPEQRRSDQQRFSGRREFVHERHGGSGLHRFVQPMDAGNQVTKDVGWVESPSPTRAQKNGLVGLADPTHPTVFIW